MPRPPSKKLIPLQLSQDFQTYFKNLFSECNSDSEAFFAHLCNGSKTLALRCKHGMTATELSKATGWSLKPIPWSPNGFYYPNDARPGCHPYLHAGAYYMQEAAAQAVVTILNPEPGELVLDVASAPGGKSTQICDALKGNSSVVCNEISSERITPLLENVERWGSSSMIVTNCPAHTLVSKWGCLFDKILVDAPCSGEAMMKKDSSIMHSWGGKRIHRFAEIQLELLNQSANLLQNGGTMVYSTCTFNPCENEGVIARFLNQRKDFQLLDAKSRLPSSCQNLSYIGRGMPQWVTETDGISSSDISGMQLEKCVRIWPHSDEADGHFIACLQKTSSNDEEQSSKQHRHHHHRGNLSRSASLQWSKFLKEYLSNSELFQSVFDDGNHFITERDGHLYLTPTDIPSLTQGLNCVSPGLYLGRIQGGDHGGDFRFIPSVALAHGVGRKDIHWKNIPNIDLDVKNAMELINSSAARVGETHENRDDNQSKESSKGQVVLVTVEGHPLAWGVVKSGYVRQCRNSNLRYR